MKSLIVLITLAVGATGCNLVFDIDGFPYTASDLPDVMVPDLVEDMGMDTPPDLKPDMIVEPDMPIDLPDDAPDIPVEVPSLMITEIMINTLPQGNGGEMGEYIEVKNVGQTPVDPRQISIILRNDMVRSNSISIPPPITEEQLEMYQALNLIEPGEYFVFIRFSIPELPIETIVGVGNFFDFGTFGTGASISNSGVRSADLQYFHSNEFVIMDTVRWAGGALRPSNPELDTPSLAIVEDVSFGVRPGFEDPDINDSPENWCLETQRSAGAESFIGSPGGPAQCD